MIFALIAHDCGVKNSERAIRKRVIDKFIKLDVLCTCTFYCAGRDSKAKSKVYALYYFPEPCPMIIGVTQFLWL